MQNYYIYFMTSQNGKALYVGVTNNLKRRVIEHRTYDPKSFTSRYKCHKLLYLLKNSGQMKTPPKWGDEKPCKDLIDAFEIGDFGRMKREQYDKDMYDEKRRNGKLTAGMEVGQVILFTGLDRETVEKL